jgi:ArsR family transcriptional regulator, arsenate/arsenite/antimonite-responsive transcriptional repressor
MDFFDDCRYSLAMATRAMLTLDPIACCAPVRTDVLDQAQAVLLANSFAALADPIRLRLLSHIAAAGGEEVCACDLTDVKILVDAGLVDREKRGLWVWYRLVASRLDALRSVLG